MNSKIKEVKEILKITLNTKHVKIYKNGNIVVTFKYRPQQMSSKFSNTEILKDKVRESVRRVVNLPYKIHTVEKKPIANHALYVRALKAPCPYVKQAELKSLLGYFTDNRRTSFKSIMITLTPPSPEAFYDALAEL